MSAGAIVAIIVAVVVVVLVIGAMSAARRRKLQQRFGPEYDRVVGETHSHRKADAELAERERRVRSLDIRPLDETVRAKYAGEWTAIQERFVDQPEQAVAQAGMLVTSVMKDRGYPTEDYDQILADLSVEHANTLDHYRAATSGQPAGRGGHRLHRGPAPRDAALPGAVRRPARPAGGSRHRTRPGPAGQRGGGRCASGRDAARERSRCRTRACRPTRGPPGQVRLVPPTRTPSLSCPRPGPARPDNRRPADRPRRVARPTRTPPAVGSAALAAHVQPDDGPGRLAAPDLHEVAHLVDHPQAVAGVLG